MTAIDRWLAHAEVVYRGEDDGKLFDRGWRLTGEVDRTVFTFIILKELRAIRSALERTLASKPDPRS